MRNRKVYVLYGMLSIILLILLLAPFLKQQVFSDAPISNKMTLEELQKQKIRVTYVETMKEWDNASIKAFGEEQLKKAKKCKTVFIVKPTGNLYFNEGLILQEVKIEKIVRGKEMSDTIWVRNGLHSTLTYDKEKGEVELSGMNRSFMQIGCEYLLFCKPFETNQYSKHKIYTEVDDMWFGCYNLTKSSNKTVSLKKAYYDPSIEFYVDDKRLLSAFNEAKKKVMEYIRKNFIELL